MVYPILLTVIATLIITVMLIFVVPKVVGVFETTGQQLPLMTRALIAISEFMQNWWFLMLAGIAGAILLAQRLLKREHIRRRVHLWLLRAPIFGRVTRGLNTARFTRTLSILTAERRAGLGSAADQRHGRRESTDARRRRRGGRARARRWCDRPLSDAIEAVSLQ